jgi:predicted Rossmann fold flavoprotein
MWSILKKLSIGIVPPVPSLFTFNIEHDLLADHAGLSFENAIVQIPKIDVSESGPLLITHRGLSGPVVLKVSAWAARKLSKLNYKFELKINWIGMDKKDVLKELKKIQTEKPKQYVIKHSMFNIPKRFWIRICRLSGINDYRNWAETGKKQLNPLIDMICESSLTVVGKSTFKEEFVTAGGIELDDIDLKTFELKQIEELYAAGEVLNIDAVTGGFNFQAAWTSGYLAGRNIGLRSE